MKPIHRRTLLRALGVAGYSFLAPVVARADQRQQVPEGSDNPFIGTWTYRSFLRDPDITKPFNDLYFAAGELVIQASAFGVFRGRLSFDKDGLALKGTISFGNPFEVRFQGVGDTEGTKAWVYDYLGFLSPAWPNGVDERPAIIGTIIRTVPHSEGKAKAGVVASWIAVKQDTSKSKGVAPLP
jgi:hypothetical protein